MKKVLLGLGKWPRIACKQCISPRPKHSASMRARLGNVDSMGLSRMGS